MSCVVINVEQTSGGLLSCQHLWVLTSPQRASWCEQASNNPNGVDSNSQHTLGSDPNVLALLKIILMVHIFNSAAKESVTSYWTVVAELSRSTAQVQLFQ